MHPTWLLLKGISVGIIATLTMDILSVVASKSRLINPLSPRLVARWFASVARGRPLVSDIEKVPPVDREMAIALFGHYSIGVALALAYLAVGSALALDIKNPLAALSFALCTNVLPWLLMFPAMGYGRFGFRGSPRFRLLWSSFVNHAFYGVGLWLGSSIVT